MANVSMTGPGRAVVLNYTKYIQYIDAHLNEDESLPLDLRVRRIRLCIDEKDVEKYRQAFAFRLKKRMGPRSYFQLLYDQMELLAAFSRLNRRGAKEEAIKVAYVKYCLENAAYLGHRMA